MWELDRKEGWVLKNWCFRIVVLEKTLESHLDNREIKPANPKGNQLWVVTGWTNAEAEAPMLWPPEAKSWFTGKDPGAWKDWRQKKWLNSITDSVDMNLSKLWEVAEGRGAWRGAVHRVTKSQTWLSDLTTTTKVNQQLLRLGIHTIKTTTTTKQQSLVANEEGMRCG